MTSDPNGSEDPPIDDEDGYGRSVSNPFESLSSIQKIIKNLPTLELPEFPPPELLQALAQPKINAELIRSFQQPTIDPEVVKALSQPSIDPEVVKALSQPSVDPAVLEAIQQPKINQAVLDSLAAPAINTELISALEATNQSAFLRLYKSAAALEQVQDDPTPDVDGFPEGQDWKSPEEGGFLSTFFNITAFHILTQSEDLSEESTNYLFNVIESERVQEKSNALKDFLGSVKSSASTLILISALFAYQLTWSMYFGADTEDEDEDDNDDEDEDEDDEGENGDDGD